MNNPHLALIFIRRFSDFFREPLDTQHFLQAATRRAPLAPYGRAPLRGDLIRTTLPSMRHMVVIVPELTGYASIRHIAVSLPYASHSSTTSNTWSRRT